MAYWKVLICLGIGILTFSACDNCKSVECNTPPPALTFQLLDIDSGEDLIANGTYVDEDISITTTGGSTVTHNLQVTEVDDRFFFIDQDIGWEVDNDDYLLHLNDQEALPFSFLTQKKVDDCCTFFSFLEIRSDSILFEYSNSTDIFSFKF